jgi:hypothetical protein
VRGDVCVWWGRRKKKGMGVHGWWEKEMGSGVYVYGGKKWGVEKKEEKKIEKETTKLVLFVCSFCLVQSVEL